MRILLPFAKVFLGFLEIVYTILRKRPIPVFPYDRKTKTISLPKNIEKEIMQLAVRSGKVEAVKRVSNLTGAGLRISKDYVDALTLFGIFKH